MRWSLNTYQTCQDWELSKILKIAEDTGYHGVELLMDYKQKHGFEWDTPQDQWSRLKDEVDASRVVISSLTSCQNFHSPEVADRAESVRRIKRVIEMADFMGCDHVRVLGDRFDDNTRDAVVGYVTEGLNEVGEYAQPKGITVSIEMHGSFIDPVPAMEVIKSVNLQGGSIEPLFSQVAAHITAVHTHAAEDPETFELYRQMFEWLQRIGFDGYISNECAYRGPDPEKVLALYVGLFKAFVEE